MRGAASMSTELKENIMPAAPAAKPKKRRKVASLDKKKARAGWFFLLPFILGLVFIYLPVIWNALRMTVGVIDFPKELFINDGGKVIQTMTYQFEGWVYYKEALTVDPEFSTILVTGLKQLFIDVPAIVIFSLFMAVLLNQKMFGRAAFRAIFFIPVIVSTGIIATLDANNALLTAMVDGSTIDTGAQSEESSMGGVDLSFLFSNMAIGSGITNYVSKLVNDIYNIINRSGVQMLIFLAGLQSISGAIYESCSIDGASAWETFWKITLPMVSPMILVNAVYTVIDSFTSSSNTVMRFINNKLTTGGGESLATAMAWIYFMIVILIILVVVSILRVFIFYQRRD